MRLAPRTDANQSAIVAALEDAGCSVTLLSAVGKGCPDLLVGASGRTLLMECKDGSKPPSARRLTPAQQAWHAAWQGGTLAIVDSVEAALRVVATVRAS